jgi:NADP-dependent 3-hydroxy acid dehydrogenase YdfG
MRKKSNLKSINKTVIVTGASKGIGKAISKVFAKKGYNLVLVSRSEEALKKVKEDLDKYGNKIIVIPADITKSTDVKNVYKQVFSKFARVNVLVNNAGTGIFKPIEKITSKDWDTVMNLNAKGTFLMTRELISHFKEAKEGMIINILSDVAKRTFRFGSLYTASKYAQLAFTDTVRKELQAYGIRVTNILPGITATEFAGNDPDDPSAKKYLKPENISRSVDYIISAPKHIVVDEITLHPLSQLPE